MLPSIKTLMQLRYSTGQEIDKQDARKIRIILECNDKNDMLSSMYTYYNHLYHSYHQHYELHSIKLIIINDILSGYGIEYISDKNDTCYTAKGIEYVNMGDTYDTTLCYDILKGLYYVTSWGDIVECQAKRFGFE